jgi:hypothetical protein
VYWQRKKQKTKQSINMNHNRTMSYQLIKRFCTTWPKSFFTTWHKLVVVVCKVSVQRREVELLRWVNYWLWVRFRVHVPRPGPSPSGSCQHHTAEVLLSASFVLATLCASCAQYYRQNMSLLYVRTLMERTQPLRILFDVWIRALPFRCINQAATSRSRITTMECRHK